MIELEDIGINLNNNQIITIVGAGGKTSLMYDIANKLKKFNKRVLITTTTKIYIPEKNFSDEFLVGSVDIFNAYNPPKRSITVSGKDILNKIKYIGFSKEEIEYIHNKNIFDYIIIEGDGAKKKSLKAPKNFEPVVPKITNILLGVIGMDILDKKINKENIYGLEEFLRITEKNINDNVDKDSLIKLIENKNGLFKLKGNENYLILNKVNQGNLNTANEIKNEINNRCSNIIKNTILLEEIL